MTVESLYTFPTSCWRPQITGPLPWAGLGWGGHTTADVRANDWRPPAPVCVSRISFGTAPITLALRSRIGKMKLRQMPRLQAGAGGMGEATWEERAVLNGRLVADTYLLSREYLKESSYKLLRLAMAQGLEGPSGKITEAMVEEVWSAALAR